MRIKIAYLLTHPIPYQSSLIRELSKSKKFYLKVFYCSNITISDYKDNEMNKVINWNYDLLSGYDFDFLKSFFNSKIPSFFFPINIGLLYKLKKNKFDYILVHGHARFYNIFIIIFSKLIGINVFLRSESNDMHSKKKTLSKITLKFLNLFIKNFLAIGELNKKYYLDRGIKNNKIVMMPYTVDNNYFMNYKLNLRDKNKFINKYNLQNKKIYLFAAKLIHRKNIIFFLNSFIDFINSETIYKKKAFLIIVGDGELREKVLKLISPFKENFLFLGYQDQSKIPFYYYISHFFVIPSKEENWGLTVNESLCCGLPVISSDSVGSSYDLLNYDNSFIFKNNNKKDLIKVLIQSFVSNKNDMSKSCINTIKNFNNNNNMKIIERLI